MTSERSSSEAIIRVQEVIQGLRDVKVCISPQWKLRYPPQGNWPEGVNLDIPGYQTQ